MIATTGAATAGGVWTESVAYERNSSTTLKVRNPDNLDIAVTIDTPDGPKSGTVPEVFTLANNDAYVKVTLKAPDGAVWSKKIEVKARQQTTLDITYKAEAAASEKKKGRTFIAKVLNSSQGCGKKNEGKVKLDFLDEGGATAATVSVDTRYEQEFSLPAGKLDARVFLKGQYVMTQSVNATKDGLYLQFGCDAKTYAFVLIAN